jgi:hypothetical protein
MTDSRRTLPSTTSTLAGDDPRRPPYGELRTYADVDPFDIYDRPEFERVLADRLNFFDVTWTCLTP